MLGYFDSTPTKPICRTPIFTKRHYRLIARALYEATRLDSGISFEQTRLEGIHRAASMLQDTNPNFDRNRFIAACLDGCDTAFGPSRAPRKGEQSRNLIR